MAKVSIIVPIYNVEEYIEKCLISLTKQTFKDIAIYAIIDGSPDNSADIVKRIAKKDKRITCIEKENGGYGSVLEYAIKNVKTDYILICDPDDWLPDNAVEKLYNKIAKEKLDIVVADKYDVMYETKEEIYSSAQMGEIKIDFEHEKNIEKYAFLKCSPHAKLYRREILKDINFEHKVSYTDFTLYMVALTKCKKIGYIQEPLAYYLLDRPGNTTTDKTIRALIAHIKVWKSTYEQIIKSKNTKHSYLMYRLFVEFKIIIRLYSKVSKAADKQIYNDLKEIKVLIKRYKKDILLIKEIKKSKRLDIRLVLSNIITVKMYITFNKLINKNYR